MGIVDINSFDTRRKTAFSFSHNKLTNLGSLVRVPEANVIYVDDDANGAEDGSNWTDAYTDLQDALSDAETSGKDIWVAEGTYYPDEGDSVTDDNRFETFQLSEGVKMYGGFDPGSGDDTWAERDYVNNKTILSGDIDKDSTLDADNSFHVVTALEVEGAVLDGLTVTAGYADGDGLDGSGGGIWNKSSALTVSNCTFSENSAQSYGGGIFNSYSSCEVSHCIFSDCDAFNGGGIYILSSGDHTIKNSFFIDNSAGYGGGAVHFDTAPGTIVNCAFTRNKAERYGGALWLENFDISTTVVNSTFYANDANDEGGGIWLCNDGATITNCVFWGNTDDYGSHDEYDQIYIYGEDPNISYSCIQDEADDEDIPFPGTGPGRTDDEPKFIDVNDPNGEDDIFGTLDDGLYLESDSNCIDAGNPDTNSTDVGYSDITGYDRFVDGDSNGTEIIDIGAYEYNPNPVKFDRVPWTVALAINNSGLIVGSSKNSNGIAHAFINIPSQGNEPYPWVCTLTDLHPEGDSNVGAAYDISDSNWIVGSVGEKAFVMHYPNDMNMRVLPSLFSETEPESVACSIIEGLNGDGPIAAGYSGGRAVLWENLDSNEPTIHNLGTVSPYHKSKAYKVNKYGQVAGFYYPAMAGDAPDRAFIGSKSEGLRDIGTLGQGNISRALCIDNLGRVVGEATIDSNDAELRAFIYDSGQMYNLNDLISRDFNDPNWQVLSAQAITDDGFIVGYGRCDDSNGYSRTVLLVPARPIGIWQFDEGSGTTAIDSSIYGNHGKVYDAEWAEGRIRGALDFDGSDGVCIDSSSGEDSVLNIWDTDLTICAWVKSRNSGGTIIARAKEISTSYRLGISADKAYLNTYLDGEGDWTIYSDAVINQDTWHHIVGIFDRSNDIARIYIDGFKKGDAEITMNPESNDASTKIGCRKNTNDEGFDGLIDDVRIYPWALREKEVKNLFEGKGLLKF